MYLVNERIDKQSFSSLGEECEDHVKDHATLCNVSVSTVLKHLLEIGLRTGHRAFFQEEMKNKLLIGRTGLFSGHDDLAQD